MKLISINADERQGPAAQQGLYFWLSEVTILQKENPCRLDCREQLFFLSDLAIVNQFCSAAMPAPVPLVETGAGVCKKESC